MSVNYGPHEVDIPITDLDDLEDDIIFSEQRGDNNLFPPRYTPEGKNIFSNLFKKVGSIFRSNSTEEHDFELFNVTASRSDSFEIENESIYSDFDLRKYRIQRLLKKLKRITWFGIISIVILVSITIFLIRKLSNKVSDGNLIYNKINSKLILKNGTHEFYPTTILISLDGFHPHYINFRDTPTMHSIMVNEFGAPYMNPSFPSSTFPNHWTLVTGLYPADHGIVGNTFFDPTLNKQFINTNPKVGGLDPEFWQGGEPIWKTASKQGVNSAVHMWPGSEVEGVGINNGPLYVDRYNGSELLSSKVNRIMGWLDESDISKRPELILSYVPTIDQYGHKFGISGQNLTSALKYVDDFVGSVKQGLSERGLTDIVNLIIVSDHGMAPTSNSRLLYIDDLIDLDKIEHIDGWPLFGLRPHKEFSIIEIYNELREKLDSLHADIRDNYKIYLLEEIPKEWQFGGKMGDHTFNYRLAPIWVIPNVGYSITTHQSMKDNNNQYAPKGVHGYNNTELLMRAIFLGSGRYFNQQLRSAKKIKPFQNTEVYNIICESLSLIPAPNNGSQLHDVVSPNNILPNYWQEELDFPNLPYDIEHIVQNATYDILWRKGPNNLKQAPKAAGNKNEPFKSLISEESTISIKPESLPKPSDFIVSDFFQSTTSSRYVSHTTDLPKNGLKKIWENIEDDIGDFAEGVDNSIDDTFEKIGDWYHELIDGEDER